MALQPLWSIVWSLVRSTIAQLRLLPVYCLRGRENKWTTKNLWAFSRTGAACKDPSYKEKSSDTAGPHSSGLVQWTPFSHGEEGGTQTQRHKRGGERMYPCLCNNSQTYIHFHCGRCSHLRLEQREKCTEASYECHFQLITLTYWWRWSIKEGCLRFALQLS